MVNFKRFMRKRESWPRFASKVALVLGLMAGVGAAAGSRYSIAYDPQEVSCIEEYDVYLVDHGDTEMVRGGLYAFDSGVLEPFYKESRPLIKYLKGMPGDQVEINADQQVLINGEFVTYGLHLSEKMKREPTSFMGKGQLSENQYWMLGTSQESFDSRYWGAARKEQVFGRVYPIF